MKPPENIKKLIKNIEIDTNAEMDRVVLADVLKALENSKETKSAKFGPNIGRIIMKSRITKLAAAAVIVVVVILSIIFLDKSATPAWAIGQSVKALKNIETALVNGKVVLGRRPIKFKLRIKGEMGNWDSFRGRVESNEIIGVIQDNTCYQYFRGGREIYSYNLEDTKGKGIGTKLWYEVMKNAPWIAPIAPTMLEAAKALASDWREVYEKDKLTGRDCVFVTGSYKPLSASFWIVFDIETKLIVRAKYWTNAKREGIPGLNIEKIVYNEEIPDEIFDLEKTTGAKVVNEEETEKRSALWREGVDLDRKKQYPEAIKVYQQLYDKYPRFIKTPEALVLIGICYREIKKYDKAIEFFERVPREYSAPRYAILDAHKLLGHCCMLVGQDTKAIEAFETYLELIGKWDPEGRRFRKSREWVEKNIEEIKNKNR